ncbi:pyrophosphate--fructose 6-phosphate 1-phosphotransferase [Vallitalea longa]|uniref:Pyrophosphate--fructose 6-phosphate 1-phosphotransferase n=1 Tax=Vallitalea longa TaxID=2936439 RepID=A0A9W5Y929_9FIRM|nr:6-phosphofructokinase [Vallitalea longa]GKX28326.1 pyrophosphate--fructose 6-phosphate 1-phosphotransferase [Vallitalea longa]
MSNCLIAQSGGPTTVINASLSGAIATALESTDIEIIYGAINGIQGVLNENLINLTSIFLNNKDYLETLKTTPSMFLGSCRYRLSHYQENEDEYIRIFDLLQKLDIRYFFYIGGNDSMDTVLKLYEYAQLKNIDINIIGIPKTIDNDLYGTDHTPGFGSAAKYVATTMLEIAHDAYIYDVESVTIVEIMGRNAGWLTAASALSRNEYNPSPDLIYLPEVTFSISTFLDDVRTVLKNKKNVIIAVSEGIRSANENYIAASEALATDTFGHARLKGTAKTLGHIIERTLKCKVRSIELNVLQRSAMHIASLTDINEAFSIGEQAVKYALDGISGEMMTIIRYQNDPYEHKIFHSDIKEIANREKQIPREWINDKGNDITQELVDYIRPLIIGEPSIGYKNGVPIYIDIRHLINGFGN